MKSGAAIATLACALVACRAPWTVRPIGAVEPEDGAAAPFDATRYVSSIWDSKVVPAAEAGADFAASLGARRPVLVRGDARVIRIDRDRARAILDVAPLDGKPDAELATGVIRGTALRDALPFLSFNQFVNQVDFAHAANALDDRAAAAVRAQIAGLSSGASLAFAGALDFSAGGNLPEIIPVILSREPARP